VGPDVRLCLLSANGGQRSGTTEGQEREGREIVESSGSTQSRRGRKNAYPKGNMRWASREKSLCGLEEGSLKNNRSRKEIPSVINKKETSENSGGDGCAHSKKKSGQ